MNESSMFKSFNKISRYINLIPFHMADQLNEEQIA